MRRLHLLAALCLLALPGFPALAQPGVQGTAESPPAKIESEVDLERFRPLIDRMFASLEALIEQGAETEALVQSVELASAAILDGRVGLVINPTTRSVLSGASFQWKEDGGAQVAFGTDFLDAFDRAPGLVLAILVHELRHAHDFVTDKPAFSASLKDARERLWYELDAIQLEAVFIEECLEGRFPLSGFERFLLASWKTDSLDSAAMILQRESREVFALFGSFEADFRDGTATEAELVERALSFIEESLADYRASSEFDFKQYYRYTSLRTAKAYFVRLVSVVYDGQGLTWAELFARYAGIEPALQAMDAIALADAEKADALHRKFIAAWEAELVR